jgi:beta-glucanase (GH16 family)
MTKNPMGFKRNLVIAGMALALSGCLSDADGPRKSELAHINKAPIIATSPSLSAEAKTPYSYTLSATDANSEDTLTWSATELPAWLSFDSATGVLSGTAASSDVGEHTVIIAVSDGIETVIQSFTLTVSHAKSGGSWSLIWSDEFDGSTLNADNWNIQSGDGTEYGLTAWGNNEQEWYQAENITLADGHLVITAKEQAINGYPYTSGRLRSNNKVDVKYGRIEARVKTPVGQGLWSAFWMLPTDSAYGGWASGGEIDIMEAVNAGVDDNVDDVTYGTLHYGMPWPLNQSAQGLADRTPIDEFHTYTIEWEESEIRWFIDDLHYATITADTWWSYYYANNEQGYVSAPLAPFNQDFHMLFNLAVGGNWPGSPNADTVFPAEMLVDYVRVYQCDSGEASGTGCANNINSSVTAPPSAGVFVASQTLYNDGISPLSWVIEEDTIERELQVAVAWSNDGAITLTEQDIGGDHGTVLEVTTSNMGNIAISAVDTEVIDLFGMGNSAEWWKLGAGEIKFDLYIDSALTTNDSNILVKMDSGWPALGSKSFAVADLAKDTWISVSVPVNDLTATPGEQALDTSSVVNLFVVEFSAAAHVQIDNIELVCAHKDAKGCGVKPPSIEVSTELLEVFNDAINSEIWTNGAGAWDDAIGSDYYTGDSANHVNWQLVDSGDAEHDSVLEVNFNADGADGVFYIQSAQPVNLTSFSSGNLIFDIKVSDYAGNTGGIDFKVDCIHPCSTGDQSLGLVGDGEWQTITVPVSDLVGQGLNLNTVNSGLVIFPSWGSQQGVTMQLDNIRWQVGEVGVEPPAPDVGAGVVIYADDVDANWSLWDCCGGSTLAQVSDDETHGSVVEVSFNSTATVAGFEGASPHNASGLTNGTLEFDLKMLVAPLDASTPWLLKVETSSDAIFAQLDLNQSNEGVAPTLDTWQHFTFSLDNLSAAGLTLTDIKIIMVFPEWDKAEGVVYRLDNLVLSGD